MDQSLVESVADLDEIAVLRRVDERLKAGNHPLEILEEVRLGVKMVGERYATGDYGLSALIMSAEVFRQVVEMLEGSLANVEIPRGAGRVLIGTVEGDIHDLGKNIMGRMLAFSGFDVVDLGVDVSPKKFVDTALEFEPEVIGLSCLMTPAFKSLKKTIQLLRSTMGQSCPPIIIGGSMVNEVVRREVGGDLIGHDAIEAIRLCTRICRFDSDRRALRHGPALVDAP
ncbi:MAG: cobalamin-dependent protein [Chloroflexi bacterium]|nr:cobalamin-dependent protein [Chloroflexota bacterium]MDA8189857.1 cobalamin-dependent protein [Dehalococcoidales bacterium]